MATRWLFTFPDGKPFAYSDDAEKNYFLAEGGTFWAFGDDRGWLFEAKGGQALGFFKDNTFFSPTGKPLYFRGTR